MKRSRLWRGSNVGPISNRTCPVGNRTYWSSASPSVYDNGGDAGGRFSMAEFLIAIRYRMPRRTNGRRVAAIVFALDTRAT
ncbi:MAG: hypothetical protein WC340_12205 [Kiritimatiellia bacterium]